MSQLFVLIIQTLTSGKFGYWVSGNPGHWQTTNAYYEKSISGFGWINPSVVFDSKTNSYKPIGGGWGVGIGAGATFNSTWQTFATPTINAYKIINSVAKFINDNSLPKPVLYYK